MGRGGRRRAAAIAAPLADRSATALGTPSADSPAERIRQLLAGRSQDAPGLGYEFDAHYLGAVTGGAGGEEALRSIADELDLCLLHVNHGGEVWAWFGSRHIPARSELTAAISDRWPEGLPLAMGEPASGLSGWRLTHRQARAAFPIAQRRPGGIVLYADVAVLASLVQDDLLTTSLRQIYLEPLEGRRDRGVVLRQTLRAYFRSGRNASATATALGVCRNTVSNRLRAIEERTGRALESCAAEFEAASRLDELGDDIGSSEVGEPAS